MGAVLNWMLSKIWICIQLNDIMMVVIMCVDIETYLSTFSYMLPSKNKIFLMILSLHSKMNLFAIFLL
jgi:hypothetical protein